MESLITNNSSNFFSQAKNNTSLFVMICCFFLQAIVVAAAFAEVFWLYCFLILLGMAIIVFIRSSRWVVFMIGLIPVSQAVPLVIGNRSIGLFPEYIVIPLLAIAFLFRRWRMNDYSFERTGLIAPSLFFMFIAFISLLHSGAVVGYSKVISGMGMLYVYFLSLLFFIVFLDWLQSERQIKSLIYVLFVSAIVIAIIGIFEYAFRVDREGFVYRISSLFGTIFWKEGGGNPNSLGAYFMIMSLLAISLRKEYQGVQNLVLWVCIVTCIVGLFMTSSRSSLAAFTIGLAIIGFRRDWKLLFWIMPIAILVLSYFLMIPRISDRIQSIITIATDPKIINLFSRLDPKSLDWDYIHYFGLMGYNIDIVAGALRITAWVLGLASFFSHPWLGIGLKMNVYYYGTETFENYLIDLAVMTGVFGLLAFSWLCWRVVKIIAIGSRNVNAESPFNKSYVLACQGILTGVIIVSITGSVMFSMKLMLLVTIFIAMLWRICTLRMHKNIQE